MKLKNSPRFMASLLMLLLAALLTGCGPEAERMGRGKMLKDAEGCAYMARNSTGDTVFLTYMKELSEPTCDFKPE